MVRHETFCGIKTRCTKEPVALASYFLRRPTTNDHDDPEPLWAKIGEL